jgi:glycosyltransferase involved in cell wall biosynthesis
MKSKLVYSVTKMVHIVLIGPGISSIPPKGWGACESLIWDYKLFLEKDPLIKVTIVNTPNRDAIVSETNSLQPDVVHIQYDDHWVIHSKLKCKYIILTGHYAYLDQLDTFRYNEYRETILKGFLSLSQVPNIFIFALSPSIQDMYIKHGFPKDKVFVMHNGANDEIFRYTETPKFTERSLYLGKIETRKRQRFFQSIDCIDFAGNCTDAAFNKSNPRYLGEWTKSVLYDSLTDYANLILISDGEAHPLVVCEALVCGLGLVISKEASANLDLSLPWIEIIPDDKISDLQYVQNVIIKNQIISVQNRKLIRDYGLKHFSWTVVTKQYKYLLNSIRDEYCPLQLEADQLPDLGKSETPKVHKLQIVSAYYKIPSKRKHDEYIRYLIAFFQGISTCVFFTTRDIQLQLTQLTATDHVTFILLPFEEFKAITSLGLEFWKRQCSRDAEKYHTPELGAMWYEKRHFVLRAIELDVKQDIDVFVWCDAGCVRNIESESALKQFGKRNRFNLNDSKLHIQEHQENSRRKIKQEFYSFGSSHSVAAAIMAGNRSAWNDFHDIYEKVIREYDTAQVSANMDQFIIQSCIDIREDLFVLHNDPTRVDTWFKFLELL